jgi:tetratricopeptide (TPR) repeat protein
MMRASLLCVVLLTLLGACTASGPRRSSLSDDDLLSGAALGWSEVDAAHATVSVEEAFGVDDDIRSFVSRFRSFRDPDERLQRLLRAMEERGLFSLDYANAVTHTVSETFHEKQGNCLSFTMLFVTLARELGLPASYQLVDVPPTWNRDVDLVVIGNHINAIVDTGFNDRLVVDFNVTDFRGNYPMRKIGDDYAAALFYTNLGAEALQRRESRLSFDLFREAIRARDDVPEPWVNLGVLYGRHQRYDYAEAAYLRALEVDPRERSALANLVGVYTALGNEALAEEYRQRVRRYRELNPFYHYSEAQTAYDEGRFDDALESARKAIRLKRDQREFYDLQGRALAALGRGAKAAASFERAVVDVHLRSLGEIEWPSATRARASGVPRMPPSEASRADSTAEAANADLPETP